MNQIPFKKEAEFLKGGCPRGTNLGGGGGGLGRGGGTLNGGELDNNEIRKGTGRTKLWYKKKTHR